VRRLARLAGANGRLAAVERRPTILFELSRFTNPPSWKADPVDPGIVYPHSSGTGTAAIDSGHGGSFEAWLGGAFRQPVTFTSDGKTAKRVGYTINLTGDYTRLGTVRFAAGTHRIGLGYGGHVLHPGSGGDPLPLGPLVLGSGAADFPVTYVPAARARTLCGQTLDWVEALADKSLRR
jgi:hypothetical protein